MVTDMVEEVWNATNRLFPLEVWHEQFLAGTECVYLTQGRIHILGTSCPETLHLQVPTWVPHVAIF